MAGRLVRTMKRTPGLRSFGVALQKGRIQCRVARNRANVDREVQLGADRSLGRINRVLASGDLDRRGEVLMKLEMASGKRWARQRRVDAQERRLHRL